MELKTNERAFPVLRIVFIASVALTLLLGLYFLIAGLSDPTLTMPNPYGLPKAISL